MSNIEWTDTTWNPVVGCTPVSPGCLNCYAATMARRLEAMGRPEYAVREDPMTARELREVCAKLNAATGTSKLDDHEMVKEIRIAEVRGGRAVFTGEVRTLEHRLADPLHWRKPRLVFVNSMSDLFHEDVPFEFIDRVFAVMALCPQHTFQVLTKRPERMAEYFGQLTWAHPPESSRPVECSAVHRRVRKLADAIAEERSGGGAWRESYNNVWPLPNVWLGTSVERQEEADQRIPHLLRCPAAVRFLSCEPLLGPVDLDQAMPTPLYHCAGCGNEKRKDYCEPCGTQDNTCTNEIRSIHWVIVGGESGGKARACDVEWIRSIVRQCKAASVPVFVKQLGAKPYSDLDLLSGEPVIGRVYEPTIGDDFDTHLIADRKGGDPAEWPEDLRVREMPAGYSVTASLRHSVTPERSPTEARG